MIQAVQGSGKGTRVCSYSSLCVLKPWTVHESAAHGSDETSTRIANWSPGDTASSAPCKMLNLAGLLFSLPQKSPLLLGPEMKQKGTFWVGWEGLGLGSGQ